MISAWASPFKFIDIAEFWKTGFLYSNIIYTPPPHRTTSGIKYRNINVCFKVELVQIHIVSAPRVWVGPKQGDI